MNVKVAIALAMPLLASVFFLVSSLQKVSLLQETAAGIAESSDEFQSQLARIRSSQEDMAPNAVARVIQNLDQINREEIHALHTLAQRQLSLLAMGFGVVSVGILAAGVYLRKFEPLSTRGPD